MEWFAASTRRARTRRLWPHLLTGLLALVVVPVAAPDDAAAAEFTDLLDAADDMDDFDESTYDPFDINLEPSFHFNHTRAQILRERPCVPSGHESLDDPAVQNNPHLETGDCADPGIVDRKELRYRHFETSVSFDLRMGLYKDLELHASVPYVFQSTHGMKYANNAQFADDRVDETNSSVDPGDAQIEQNAEDVYSPNYNEDFSNIDQFQKYQYFEVGDDYDSHSRSGVGDPSVGLAWAPYNDYRDDTKATLLLGFDWQFPVGNVRKRDNNAVGEGQHKLKFRVASSKKFDFVEPYFGLNYELPLLTSNSPIQELKEVDQTNEGQVVTQPPMTGDITIGSEFILHEEPEEGKRYAIDARFSFGYTSEGRDYTPLYEHMVDSKCNGMTVGEMKPQFQNGNLQNPEQFSCSWLAQRPANFAASTGGNLESPAYNIDQASDDRELATNGIMTVDDYGTFSGQLGFYAQPSEYFQFKLTAGLTHQLEHFLTNARTGKDAADRREQTNDSKVDLSGQDALVERNPAYNPTYDSPGTRFKVDAYTGWEFMATTAFQF